MSTIKSLNIALIGYGKMGKEIEKIALARGHKIVCIIDKDNSIHILDPKNVDVAIEFSRPEVAFDNITHCISSNIPVISGTTGWLEKKSSAEQFCVEKEGAFLYASNFSIGVNIFFALNKFLAQMLSSNDEYSCSMTEIHHTSKLDSPSGTAITLAKDIIKESSRLNNWSDSPNKSEASTIHITSERIKDAPGTHIINYSSEIDEITISHEAKSRKGFASGAVLAAEWIIGKKGNFTMKDVLGF
jgi:4-hydroxy-tetrahydrodipicolinate reductase